MRSKIIGPTITAVLAICAFAPSPAAGQGRGPVQPNPASGPAPRLADGKPDLGNGTGSWAPRGTIEDISGSGGGGQGQSRMVEKTVDVPFLPWAKKAFDERAATQQKEDPEARCLPPGIPRILGTGFPFQIYQLPDRIMFVFEGGAHVWRPVYMDGRKHTPPEKWNPTYLGESIGHWEGDTLVVDVTGFNDRTWLDQAGHPHTEDMHVIERYTRVDAKTLHYEATIDDPKTYSKPWTTSWNIPFMPGWEPYEYICQENNKDLNHLIGK